MNDQLLTRVQVEIEDLHEFFVGWFSGRVDESMFEQGFSVRFDPECLLIPPAGVILNMGQFAAAIRDNHDTNPEFRIAIRNVTVRRVFADKVVATYEEWQRCARASKPPENGRLATVLLEDQGSRLKWLHIHETWLPEDVQRAGPYDF